MITQGFGNSVQTVNASAGGYTLTFAGQSIPLGNTTSVAATQSALQNLFGSGNVLVMSAPSSNIFTIVFLGSMANTQPTLTFTGAGDSIATTSPGLGNEVQTISLSAATGASFVLGYNGQATAPLTFNASTGADPTPAAVQAALQALPNIGAGNVTVLGTTTGNYVVVFNGALAGQNASLLSATSLGSATVSAATVGDGGYNTQGIMSVTAGTFALSTPSAVGVGTITWTAGTIRTDSSSISLTGTQAVSNPIAMALARC